MRGGEIYPVRIVAADALIDLGEAAKKMREKHAAV
jgi:hypothetical protein